MPGHFLLRRLHSTHACPGLFLFLWFGLIWRQHFFFWRHSRQALYSTDFGGELELTLFGRGSVRRGEFSKRQNWTWLGRLKEAENYWSVVVGYTLGKFKKVSLPKHRGGIVLGFSKYYLATHCARVKARWEGLVFVWLVSVWLVSVWFVIRWWRWTPSR